MALNNTKWPSDIPAPAALKTWLGKVFEAVDSKAPDSGDQLAALYAPNGVMHGMGGKAEGTKAISESRKAAWDHFESRKHEVLQVFAGKADWSDLILIGKLLAVLKNGNTVETEFIAQIQLTGDVATDPKGLLYKVWGDSAPWVKAMSG